MPVEGEAEERRGHHGSVAHDLRQYLLQGGPAGKGPLLDRPGASHPPEDEDAGHQIRRLPQCLRGCVRPLDRQAQQHHRRARGSEELPGRELKRKKDGLLVFFLLC
ncbi:hypothetical protein SAY87_029089 [Trapa incisa]|uniref:Uncharacterized protein n=1 Tax=Trapa incisa TaxID=236973 RepID=A0AAN7L313_9MYRT|nr:hypothetical protein SAY87_029089 [Trapa incisa]